MFEALTFSLQIGIVALRCMFLVVAAASIPFTLICLISVGITKIDNWLRAREIYL